ncbi:TetR-like C-terminal domain-containing protein, partial [Streptomyces scabiei]|uniref:TetR-like C-terminal domain-containing protein n=1 Tax=Streptomyces scabiei TaxID=1930 RepID=UPI000AB3A7D1
LREGQQGVATGIVAAAVARGEVAADADEDLALGVMFGPLYWRSVVVRSPKLPKGYLESLTRATAAALRAL